MDGLPSDDYFDVILYPQQGDRVKCLEADLRHHLPSLMGLSTSQWSEGLVVHAQVPFSENTLRALVAYLPEPKSFSSLPWRTIETMLRELEHHEQPDFNQMKEALLATVVRSISVDNCVGLWRLCRRFNCYLQTKCRRFILRRLNEAVIDNTIDVDFFRLSVDEVSLLFADDHLNLPKEDDIITLIKIWIDAVLPSRVQYLPQLLQTVRRRGLQLGVYSVRGIELMNTDQPPRKNQLHALSLGGFHNTPIDRMEYYDTIKNEWNLLPCVLPFKMSYHGGVLVDGKLYILGGGDAERSSFGRMYALNEEMVWEEKARMLVDRCYISNSCVELNGKIYVMGGKTSMAANRTRESSAEVYDPATNTWKFICSMQMGRSDTAAAVANGKIYVVGGFSGVTVTETVELYDPEIDKWTYVQPLNVGASGMCLLFNGQSLICLGGYDGNSRSDCVYTLDVNEKKAQWTLTRGMNKGRSHFSACFLGDEILVAGGFLNRVLSSSEICEDGEWRQITKMTCSKSALRIVTITRDMLDRMINFRPPPPADQPDADPAAPMVAA